MKNSIQESKNLSGERLLANIHNDIASSMDQYQLPWDLLSHVNEEYSEYLLNKDGHSGYYQWLALFVMAISLILGLWLWIIYNYKPWQGYTFGGLFIFTILIMLLI